MNSYLYHRGHNRFMPGPVSGLCSVTPITQIGRAEALAYKARVENDGGEIISWDDVYAALYDAIQNNYYTSIKAWYSSQFGVKKDNSTGAVSKIYDLSPNNSDAAQTTSSYRPIWTANQQNSKAGIVGGSSKYLLLSNLTLFKNIASTSLIAVAKRTGSSPVSNALIIGATTNQVGYGRALLSTYYSNEKVFIGGRRLDADSGLYLTGGGESTDACLLFGNIIYESSDLYLYKDGNLIDSMTDFLTDGNTSNTDSKTITLMALNEESRATTYFPGTLFEAMICVPAVTSRRTAIEAEMNRRWALY